MKTTTTKPEALAPADAFVGHKSTAAETPLNPPISLVPEPTLNERLAKAEADAERLQGLLTEGEKRNADLLEKLRLLERNPFNFALSNIDAGSLLIDAGDQLKALSAKVGRLQAKGVFALKLTIKPEGTAINFAGEIKVTDPKEEPARSFFFVDEEGNLSRRDPRQKEFRFSNGDRSDGQAEGNQYSDERRQ